ncbi:hypothetical protein AB0952_09115 [Streptomyces caniferus]|uniref:hypothetical protein n=1 Tax=Streptomyces caniferus TaxID=285557 RepID=UPI0034543ECB
MDRRPLLIVDEAAALMAPGSKARELMTELLLIGRKHGVQEQPESRVRRQLPRQYPTIAEFEAAPRRE